MTFVRVRSNASVCITNKEVLWRIINQESATFSVGESEDIEIFSYIGSEMYKKCSAVVFKSAINSL